MPTDPMMNAKTQNASKGLSIRLHKQEARHIHGNVNGWMAEWLLGTEWVGSWWVGRIGFLECAIPGGCFSNAHRFTFAKLTIERKSLK